MNTGSTEYLVEMKLPPPATVPTREEGIAYVERYILPTLEACERLTAAGRIVAGGPSLGRTEFVFIVRADTPREVEALVGRLPIWPRADTQVRALGTFNDRLMAAREKLAAIKAAAPAAAVSAAGNESVVLP